MEDTIAKSVEGLSTEVICAIITLIGVIFANLTARWTARDSADREIERQKRSWAHDNDVAFEKAFLTMTEAVSAFIQDSSISKQVSARASVAVALTYAKGDLANKLEALYIVLKNRPALDAEDKLLEAIHAMKKQREDKSKNRNFLKAFL